MNSFEFWNDLDKIFSAVVSYQEKNIEFNKQFINPWVNLGNVFDKQDTTKEILAHKNAIEIDPKNAQNWYELANTYVHAGNFENSIQAYHKAIDLGIESGELYKNLAMAYVMAGKHLDAIPVFQKSLSLLDSNAEKATVWNYMGNAYRKLNDYDKALHAFLQADQLENKSSLSFGQETKSVVDEVITDMKDESILEQTEVIPSAQAIEVEPVAEEEVVTNAVAEEEVVTDAVTEEEVTTGEVSLEPVQPEEETETTAPATLEFASEEEISPAQQLHVDNIEVESDLDEEIQDLGEPVSEQIPAETVLTTDETLPVSTTSQVEEPETNPGAEASVESAQKEVASHSNQAGKVSSIIAFMLGHNEDIEAEEPSSQVMEAEAAPIMDEVSLEVSENNAEQPELEVPVSGEVEAVALNTNTFDDETEPDNSDVSFSQYDATPSLSAYEEEPKEDASPVVANQNEAAPEEQDSASETRTNSEVIYADANADDNIDFSISMDTKNAHVWNELGTVYFNAGSFDDAIAAFSKAIELDQKFAWPYSNLALSYVQKGRLAEAILLYQRSIELFTNERDQAVTWNRLGNLYRRLNDYENAIMAYQRADEMDPSSNTAHQQSQYSLLGSKSLNQEISYSM